MFVGASCSVFDRAHVVDRLLDSLTSPDSSFCCYSSLVSVQNLLSIPPKPKGRKTNKVNYCLKYSYFSNQDSIIVAIKKILETFKKTLLSHSLSLFHVSRSTVMHYLETPTIADGCVLKRHSSYLSRDDDEMKEMTSSFPSIKIRNCLSSDLKRIEEIETLSFEDPYPLSLFQRLLGEYPWGFRVATIGDLVVGYCILVRTSDESSLLIASIAVDPPYKRRGIGTRLIEDAIAIGRSRIEDESRRITLQVRESNEGAISLYRKIGFREQLDHPGLLWCG